MTIDELIESYFLNEDDKINIANPKEKDEIINILYDRFIKTDKDFFYNCEDLILNTNFKSQYNGFMAGFKHGFECAKSLRKFLNEQ